MGLKDTISQDHTLADGAHPAEPSSEPSVNLTLSLSADNDMISSGPQSTSSETTGTRGHHTKPKRFSFLRFRHASDPQLSQTAKNHAVAPSMPAPTPPSIITTAPTLDDIQDSGRNMTTTPPRTTWYSPQSDQMQGDWPTTHQGGVPEQRHHSHTRPENSHPLQDTARSQAPPPYGDETTTALTLPFARMSESSRSDGSSNDPRLYATTTTTHTVSTTTTIFRLARRKINKGPLFPLPPKVQSTSSPSGSGESPCPRPSGDFTNLAPTRRDVQGNNDIPGTNATSPSRLGLHINRSLARTTSRDSTHLNHTFGGRTPLGKTFPSVPKTQNKMLEHDSLPTPTLSPSTRTSISTMGRPSLGGIFQLSRLRQSSEATFSKDSRASIPGTPASVDSRHPTLSFHREPPVVILERQEGDTPAKYLARLEEVVDRSVLVPLLTRSNDDFLRNVLRSYMRRFSFFEEPLDIAVRKLLMHVELPKETQQIDRTLQSFADRYHECNPGIFVTPDDAYFVAFSILILHTDVFNKNNKHKMQKLDYVKISRAQSGIAPEILEYFYDNIAYTPFIHVEDDMDPSKESVVPSKSQPKRASKNSGAPALKKPASGPVDPYALILEGKLDLIRPTLAEWIVNEDPFDYRAPADSLDVKQVQRSFFRSGVIQILSARSRPEAFMNQATITNPAVAQVGVVDLKVSKVGLLWRKDAKKKKARSPWQEWGAILTSSQLYLFRNATWIKSLMHQFDAHQKSGKGDVPVVYAPPLENFKPDFLVPTDDVVALLDTQYKKHKNAFVLVRKTTLEEVLLADSDADLTDWLGKLNYAATFRTAGVRMKGSCKAVSCASSHSGKEPDSQEVDYSSNSGQVPGGWKPRPVSDEKLANQVLKARRQIVTQKIEEAGIKITMVDKRLDEQLRTARHLGVLAPIQARTRNHVLAAAARLASNIRWSRIEKWRYRCHRDILRMDLEEDAGATRLPGSIPDTGPKRDISRQTRSPFSRLNSKAGPYAGGNNSRARPSTQPTGAKLFSMDELFKSPTKPKAQVHKSKGSWEIPVVFDFELRRSSSPPREHRAASREHTDTGEPDTPEGDDVALQSKGLGSFAPIEANNAGGDEQRFLVDAGILAPQSPPSVGLPEEHAKEDTSEDESGKGADSEHAEETMKARQSLQKKIHAQSHHRSRKTKDTTAARDGTDQVSSEDSERLTRNGKSFTVHGKKASVIRFGTEWQSLSGNDRVKGHKGGLVTPSSHDWDLPNVSAINHEKDSSYMVPSVADGAEVSARRSINTDCSGDLQAPVDAPSDPSLTESPKQHFANGPQIRFSRLWPINPLNSENHGTTLE